MQPWSVSSRGAAAPHFASRTASVPYATSGPVLVATEGTGMSHAPSVAAWFIAQHLRRRLLVVSVVEATLQYADAASLVAVPVFVGPDAAEDREGQVRAFLAETLPPDATFEVMIRYGPMAPEVAAAATQAAASLLIVGAAPHRQRSGYLAGVRAAQLLRRAQCPVLAVDPGLISAPRHAVAAVDFSTASVRAAREAGALLGPGGTLTLVHAVPGHGRSRQGREVTAGAGANARDAGTGAGTAGAASDTDPQAARLERLRARMSECVPPGVITAARLEAGSPVDSVLRVVADVDADLIAVGTHGPNVIERVLVGSVAASLLHQAPCSVLAAPDAAGLERADGDADLALREGAGLHAHAEARWVSAVRAFAAAHRGRHVTVEGHDAAAQAHGYTGGYVLQELGYDAQRRALEVTVGAPSAPGRHVSHAVMPVQGIVSMRDPAGREYGLAVRSDASETIIRLDTARPPR